MLCLQNAATKASPESPAVVSVEVHADFFKRVAGDKSLREALTARPLETLAAFGIHLDVELLPTSVRLPNEETLAVLVGVGGNTFWAGFFSA